MPYIKQDARLLVEVGDALSAGELNYALTLVIRGYIDNNGGVSYQRINDVLGALEGSKLEFYRRIVVPYEDKKKEENGDVY